MRMNAATVVALDGAESTIPALAEHLGGFDIALCGTNGIHWPGGCTTTSAAQAQGKRLALENSRRRVIMADASKYDVKQEMIFAGFDMGLEIITAPAETGASSKISHRKLRGRVHDHPDSVNPSPFGGGGATPPLHHLSRDERGGLLDIT
ncbi:hypothetical protein ACQ87O_00090 [Streptomyces lividans]